MPRELLEYLKRNVLCFVTYGSKELQKRKWGEERRGRKGKEGERREKGISQRGKISLALLPQRQMGMCCCCSARVRQIGTAGTAARELLLRGSKRQAAWRRGAEHTWGVARSEKYQKQIASTEIWSLKFKIYVAGNKCLKIFLKLLLNFEVNVFLVHLLKWKRFKITGLYILWPMCLLYRQPLFLVKQKDLDSASLFKATFL